MSVYGEELNSLHPGNGETETLNEWNRKGVAMSTGRMVLKEFYVGFLLLLLTFLYLSHLNAGTNLAPTEDAEALKAFRSPAGELTRMVEVDHG